MRGRLKTAGHIPGGEADAYSGRFVLRVPNGRAELAQQAEREGVSVNHYVATALAGLAHWHSRDLVA